MPEDLNLHPTDHLVDTALSPQLFGLQTVPYCTRHVDYCYDP